MITRERLLSLKLMAEENKPFEIKLFNPESVEIISLAIKGLAAEKLRDGLSGILECIEETVHPRNAEIVARDAIYQFDKELQ